MHLTVSKAPNEAFALTNCVIIHPDDVKGASDCLIVNETFVFSLLTDRSVERGHLGTSSFHRTWARMSLNEQVKVSFLDVKVFLEKIVIQVLLCCLS